MMMQTLGQFMLSLPGKLHEDDKRLHFAWSLWLTLAARVIWPPHWAFIAVFLIGLAKEFWDMRFGSGFCFFDLGANLLGSSAALSLAEAFSGPVFET